eukprot:gene44468-55308_t
MQAASALRRAKVECPMRTTSGSPPRAARVIRRTGSPGTKPICSSQGPHSGASAGACTASICMSAPTGASARVVGVGVGVIVLCRSGSGILNETDSH